MSQFIPKSIFVGTRVWSCPKSRFYVNKVKCVDTGFYNYLLDPSSSVYGLIKEDQDIS